MVVLFVAACATGRCAAPLVTLPAELATAADTFPVAGGVQQPERKLSFGPYATRKAWIGKDQISETEPTFLNAYVSQTRRKRWAGFELEAATALLFTGHCRREASKTVDHERHLVYDGKDGWHMHDTVVSSRASELYACGLSGAHGQKLRLELVDAQRGRVVGGELELKLRAIVAPTPRPPPASGAARGYVVEDRSGSLGAIELDEAPTVRLRRDLAPARRDQLAAVGMALLLLREMP